MDNVGVWNDGDNLFHYVMHPRSCHMTCKPGMVCRNEVIQRLFVFYGFQTPIFFANINIFLPRR